MGLLKLKKLSPVLQEEEIQIAETKMVMHQEIISKDEQIAELRTSLKKVQDLEMNKVDEVIKLEADIKKMKVLDQIVFFS